MDKTDRDYKSCLYFLEQQTGNKTAIAQASKAFIFDTEQDGTVWQVMPNDPSDEPFFDWYCIEYPNDQFFENIYECVVRWVTLRKWFLSGRRDKLIIHPKK